MGWNQPSGELHEITGRFPCSMSWIPEFFGTIASVVETRQLTATGVPHSKDSARASSWSCLWANSSARLATVGSKESS